MALELAESSLRKPEDRLEEDVRIANVYAIV